MAEYAFIDDREIREKLGKRLEKMQERINAIKGGKKEKAFHGAVSALVFADITRHFENEMGEKGKWEQWSDSYRAAIEGKVFFRKVGGVTIPFDTAKMENPPPPPRNNGMILQTQIGRLRQNFKPADYRINSEGITWFNDAKTSKGFPYAAAHDEGGGKLPKRSFMWLSLAALEKIAEATLDFINPTKAEK